MKKINVSDKFFGLYIGEEEIKGAIRKTAAEINRRYRNEDRPVFIGILNGAFMYMADLMRHIDFDCEAVFAKFSSYEGTGSTGAVNTLIGLNTDVRGRDVIIVEDMVETGTTIKALYATLQEAGARSVATAALMFKTNAYKEAIGIDFPSIVLEQDDFVIGFGLDYNGLGRNYKDIYVLTDGKEK